MIIKIYKEINIFFIFQSIAKKTYLFVKLYKKKGQSQEKVLCIYGFIYSDNSQFATFSYFDRDRTVIVPCRDRTVPWPCPCPLSVCVSPERVRVPWVCPRPLSVSASPERVRVSWACPCPLSVSVSPEHVRVLSYVILILFGLFIGTLVFVYIHTIHNSIFDTFFSFFPCNHDSWNHYLCISCRGVGFNITSLPD